jgi:SPP1 Gp6-like portal protein
MPLSPEAATAQARTMIGYRDAERRQLNKLHEYVRGKQPNVAVPVGSPREIRALARIARVNVLAIVVNSLTQALFVDGYRAPRDENDAPAWEIWQANALDAGQIGVHRAALTYGTAYASVLPGEPLPVIKGFSPRNMTTLYDPDDDYWPVWALRTESDKTVRLYDAESVYLFSEKSKSSLEYLGFQDHNAGVCPVVRFLNVQDLDDDNQGEVEPLIDLQDQIDLTTFSLLVTQHYQAFRTRWAIGWVAESEEALIKANAARMLTFEDSPDDVKVGEFEQAELTGYLDSRESSLRHAATLSETPIHELTGALINLSAEALVAAESGQRRKIVERQVSFGESWEQVLALAGQLNGQEPDDQAEIRWRDTESRALAATVDALGKMVSTLGIPARELWERIPNTSQQDIERWKKAAEELDPMGNLAAMLDRNLGENPRRPAQLPAGGQ